LRTFEFEAPETIDEAVSLLKKAGGSARPLAGGTDLVVQMKESATRFPYPATIVSLDRISELRGIDFADGGGLRIGAGAALAEGAGFVGSLQTMNMATIGGNVCNAAPSADTAPPLLVYDAEAVIIGPDGRRTLPIAELFRGPGQTALAPDELLVELRLPAPTPATGAAYQRNTPRKQMDIAVVGVAVALTLSGDTIERARVALGAVAPTHETFAKAAAAAVEDSSPITDIRASAEFRRHLVKVMTARQLAEAANRAKGSA